MKKINENAKVTLTIGQLKKLVKESTDNKGETIRSLRFTWDQKPIYSVWYKGEDISKEVPYYDWCEAHKNADGELEVAIDNFMSELGVEWGPLDTTPVELADTIRAGMGVDPREL